MSEKIKVIKKIKMPECFNITEVLIFSNDTGLILGTNPQDGAAIWQYFDTVTGEYKENLLID